MISLVGYGNVSHPPTPGIPCRPVLSRLCMDQSCLSIPASSQEWLLAIFKAYHKTAVTPLLMHWSYCIVLSPHTIDSLYIMVQYSTLLHIAQQLWRWNFGHTSNSQKTPIPRPHGRAMGVFCELFDKSDHEISGVHCIYLQLTPLIWTLEMPGDLARSHWSVLKNGVWATKH